MLQDVNGHNLEKPTRREQRSLGTLHLQGIAPALDIGGAWGFNGSGYDPGTLAHKTWSQIAGTLANPHDRIAQRADGLANLFTAAICSATEGRPGNVCKSRGVRLPRRPSFASTRPSHRHHRRVNTPRSARRSAVAVAVVAFVAMLFGSAAAAGAATAPRDALRQALRQVRALAPQASAGAGPASAAAALAQATAPGLWINRS